MAFTNGNPRLPPGSDDVCAEMLIVVLHDSSRDRVLMLVVVDIDGASRRNNS